MSGGGAEFSRQRALDRRDRKRIGQEARVAFQQKRPGQREGGCDTARRQGEGRARGRDSSRTNGAKKGKGKKSSKGSSAHCRLHSTIPCDAERRHASGAGWVHEISSTAIARRRGSTTGEVKLLTRKGLDWNKTLFPMSRRPSRLCGRHGADRRRDRGQRRRGVSNFSMLQAALKTARSTLYVLCV